MIFALSAGKTDETQGILQGCAMSGPIDYHRMTPDTAQLLQGADMFDNPVKPAQLAAFLDDPGHELVLARAQGKAIGFASGLRMLHPDKAPLFFINEVGVRPRRI